MWILGRISLLSTISISKRFSAFSPFPFRHLFTPPVLPPPPLCLGASSALIPSLPISAFWLIRIYSSSHLSRRKTEREYTSRKLLSHTVQEGDGVSEIKQCSLATRWMRSVCLSPTASLLLLHSLKLCISSVPPPPLLALFFFFLSVTFSVSRDVSLPSLNSPCSPLNPSSQSNGNNISNNRGPDQQNSFKSRKSSLALECWSEEGGTLTHAYRKLFIWPEIRHLLKSSLIS